MSQQDVLEILRKCNPSKEELITAEQDRLSKKGKVISAHWGFDIVQNCNVYEVWQCSFKWCWHGFNTAWDCHVYIDELLSS